MGVGLGAEIVVGYVTLSEFVPPLQRGRWGSALSAITNSALFVSAFAGLLIIPQFGWRWMFVITGVGALIVWYLRRGLPESPRWLESKGHLEEAEKVLAEIEAEASRNGPLPSATEQPTPVLPQQSIKALFEGGMLARTIVGSIVLIGINTVIYGFVAWLPTFLVKQGVSVVSSLGFTTLMALGGPVGALAGMWLGDHVGRKPVLVGFSLATIVLGFIYPFAPSEALLTLVGFALVTCVYVMVAVAWALYVPELFPTEIRMRGAGFCNTMGRLMTIITPQIVPQIFVGAGVVGVVGLMAALLLIQAIAVAFFGIETRQQSLEALRPQQPEGDAVALDAAVPRSPRT
jgi:putative MFS transporter